MAGFNQNLQNEDAGAFSSGNPYLRDYTHASKIFRTNSYQRAPKLKFLFHTYFEINDTASQGNYGLLVKEVKLPTYGFTTVQLNQYNRKRIIQTKIKYEPIEISFHDDNANEATKLWEAYYRYYYNDASKPGSVLPGARGGPAGAGAKDYNSRDIYSGDNINGDTDWGFNGGQTNSDGTKASFFKNITVFGFNQHQFTAYTLINPIITSFSHDTYNYSESSGTMSNRMTVDYETVVYNYGSMDGRDPSNIVTGFGEDATYDTRPSTITPLEANRYALGQAGLNPADGGYVENPNAGNLAGAKMAQGDAYNSVANPKLKVAIPETLNSLLVTSNQNTPTNRNTKFNIPVAKASPGPSGLANSPPIGALTIPPTPTIPTPKINVADYTVAPFQVAGKQYSGPTNIPIGFPTAPPFPRD